MYSLIIHFGIKKYELSLTIDIGFLHMYQLSLLPPKQHTIPLLVSRQISIANVSPNLTAAHIPAHAPDQIVARTVDKIVVDTTAEQRQYPTKGKRPNTISTSDSYISWQKFLIERLHHTGHMGKSRLVCFHHFVTY